MIEAAFAVPGDLETVTGGYLYEKRLLHGLRDAGTPTELIRLGGSFPDPTPDDHAQAAAALAAVPPDRPLIVDGFVFGSLSPEALAAIAAPVVGMVHHPLALEEGLTAERRRYLFETERANLRRA
ncbi:MAG: glycosyl transferase family 1, partial [Microbacterium sp.]|nr:glycosyl transferase family 1 [Microbacterium sp.]